MLTPGKFFTFGSISDMESISNYFKNFDEILYPEEAKQMIYVIMNDGFSEETKTLGRNLQLISNLNQLKTKTIDFYLQQITHNELINPEIKYNCDAHSKIGNYLFQILRFRMVIQPEIQITTNVHKQTKITYLTVKGFWLNEKGEKERKFSKSIGRADEYEMGKEDPKAIENCTAKMQSILLEEYLKYYPEK